MRRKSHTLFVLSRHLVGHQLCPTIFSIGSLAVAVTIIGIPFALQTFKIGLYCLWPFGSTIRQSENSNGCITVPLNLVWFIFGGLWTCLMHLFFGILLCITIIGIPFGTRHFNMAGLALFPFGKEVVFDI